MVNLRRDMLQGLVRLRILRAAAQAPIAGVELSEDLASVGHHVSPGTLYPLLHDLEKAGWLKSKMKTVKGKRRRYYHATKKGKAQLADALLALDQFLFDGVNAQSRLQLVATSVVDGAATLSDGHSSTSLTS